MAATYEPIATTTLTGTSTAITFTSFGGYTDLVLVCSVKNSTANWPSPRLQFNTDTAGGNTYYSNTFMYGTGSGSGSSGRQANDDGIALGNVDNANFSTVIANIMNYTNTTTYKTVVSRIGSASSNTQAYVGMWRRTGAITDITITPQVYSFDIGSTFTLYGIKAA